MNTELFIARRVFSKNGNRKGIASKIVSIAVGSISIGLAVMIVSVVVLLGFKKEIRDKVIGFGAHYQVVNYDANFSFETRPVTIDSALIEQFREIEQVKDIQFFATKPGIIKTDTEIHGMVLKGAGLNYNWDFFSKNLVDGKLPVISKEQRSNEVLISENMAKLLQLKTSDFLYSYFYNEGQNTPRNRRFTISGIYRTSLKEFDDLFVLGDLRQIQQLNGWHSSEISGYELYISDFELLEPVFMQLREITMNHATEKSILRVYSIDRKYPMLFDWLSVLDLNVWVLMILMIAVAGINMISGLLIIIIERSRMIGILKALGYPNFSVRKVFLYLSALLAVKGLFWGNIIGIGLALLQHTTKLISLDPASYYLDFVPIHFNILYLILLNAGTLLAVLAMILIPSMLISKISPVEAIAIE